MSTATQRRKYFRITEKSVHLVHLFTNTHKNPSRRYAYGTIVVNKKHLCISAAAVALIVVVCGVFVVQLYEQQAFTYSYNNRTHRLVVPTGVNGIHALSLNEYVLLGVPPVLSFETVNNGQAALTNSTRCQIYNYISDNPGLQFRALCSALCLPVGLAEYHLGVLIKAGLVSFIRDGRYKRFFITRRFTKKEMVAISLLRHKTAKRIFETLLNKKALSHCVLAQEVAITSQALTWQMKTLTNTEFITQTNQGLKTIYAIDEATVSTLQKYLSFV
jgi:hypothetical protein